jgi:hypothetical protein
MRVHTRPKIGFWLLVTTAGIGCSSEPVTMPDPPSLSQAQTNISNPPHVTVIHGTQHSTVFEVTNTGAGSGNVKLACNGKFVGCNSVTPRTFTLPAGGARDVTVVWTAGGGAAPNAILSLKDSVSLAMGSQSITIQ